MLIVGEAVVLHGAAVIYYRNEEGDGIGAVQGEGLGAIGHHLARCAGDGELQGVAGAAFGHAGEGIDPVAVAGDISGLDTVDVHHSAAARQAARIGSVALLAVLSADAALVPAVFHYCIGVDMAHQAAQAAAAAVFRPGESGRQVPGVDTVGNGAGIIGGGIDPPNNGAGINICVRLCCNLQIHCHAACDIFNGGGTGFAADPHIAAGQGADVHQPSSGRCPPGIGLH